MSKEEATPEVVEAPVQAQSVEDPGYMIVDVVGLPDASGAVDAPRKGAGGGSSIHVRGGRFN